jgi:RNA polymerase sigma-70 factor (ECF subfamily)
VDDDLRPLLFSIAYRMLGSVAEAEDVVQEAYLRRASAEGVENERAFMTTVTSRLAIDVLRSARVRRESYVGEWLPEPLVEAEAPAVVEAEESVSLAMLVLLERLNPVERAVFVLRESFDVPFDQVAAIVDRSEDNCRQILSRARKRVAEERPRFDADPAERRALASRFLAAAREGDLQGLVSLLAPDAVLVGDGGGIARALARPMVGGPAVAKAVAAFWRQIDEMGVTVEPVWVNGQPGLRASDGEGRLLSVAAFQIVDGRVAAIHSVVNPEKLGHLGETSELGLRPSVRRGR